MTTCVLIVVFQACYLIEALGHCKSMMEMQSNHQQHKRTQAVYEVQMYDGDARVQRFFGKHIDREKTNHTTCYVFKI